MNRRDKFHLGDGRPGMGARQLPTFLSLDYDRAPSAWTRIADRGAVRENAISLIHREPPSRKPIWGIHRQTGVRSRFAFATGYAWQAFGPLDYAACIGMTAPKGAFWLPVEAQITG